MSGPGCQMFTCHHFVMINYAKYLPFVHYSVIVLYFNKTFIIKHFKLSTMTPNAFRNEGESLIYKTMSLRNFF